MPNSLCWFLGQEDNKIDFRLFVFETRGSEMKFSGSGFKVEASSFMVLVLKKPATISRNRQDTESVL